MVQMGQSQCLSDREFPEFCKTPLTFDPSGIMREVMGHLKKGQGLQNGAVYNVLRDFFIN